MQFPCRIQILSVPGHRDQSQLKESAQASLPQFPHGNGSPSSSRCITRMLPFGVLVLGIFCGAKAYSECPDGYLSLPSDELCVKVYTEKKTNKDAIATCWKDGGVLTSVQNAFDNQAIYTAAKTASSSETSLWIGLHNDYDSNYFLYYDDGVMVSYKNWDTGYPVVIGGNNCVSMSLDSGSSGKKWRNDEDCESTKIFACEVLANQGLDACPFELHESTTDNQTVSLGGYYECMMILTGPAGKEIYLSVEADAVRDSYATFMNADTHETIRSYAETHSTIFEHFSSEAHNILLRSHRGPNAVLGIEITYRLIDEGCVYETFTATSAQQELTAMHVKIGDNVKDYSCTKEIKSSTQDTISIKAKGDIFGNAYLLVKDIESGTELARYDSIFDETLDTRSHDVNITMFAGSQSSDLVFSLQVFYKTGIFTD